jgi:hypothetical protein
MSRLQRSNQDEAASGYCVCFPASPPYAHRVYVEHWYHSGAPTVLSSKVCRAGHHTCKLKYPKTGKFLNPCTKILALYSLPHDSFDPIRAQTDVPATCSSFSASIRPLNFDAPSRIGGRPEDTCLPDQGGLHESAEFCSSTCRFYTIVRCSQRTSSLQRCGLSAPMMQAIR